MSDQWPKVAIIILNWNGWRDTIECLESVEALTYPNYEVILVDNGSVDDSVARIREWVMGRPERWGPAQHLPEGVAAILPAGAQVALGTERLTLIRSDENLGFAGGCNLAIDFALARDPSIGFVFLLNNDAQVEPGCLTACVAAAQNSGAGIAGAVLKSKKTGEVVFAGSHFPLELFIAAHVRRFPRSDTWWRVDRTMGAAMLVRRELLEARKARLGYIFDPDLFAYCEELELCIWAAHLGHAVVMVRDAVVYHRGAGSTGGPYNPVAYYYLTRNRIRLAKILLPAALRILFHVWYAPTRVGRALQLAVLKNFGAARAILEGLVDGYVGSGGRWHRHDSWLERTPK